jgi:hypothetical protein
MSDERNTIVQRITENAARVFELRQQALAEPKSAAARQSLRAWQARRLARTHADLLSHPKFANAATFFLTDVYGANDSSFRDEELHRVIPTMTKLLPAAGLETVADAMELDALSEDLDAAVVKALGRNVRAIDAPAYGSAYRKVGRRQDRERQIEIIRDIGHSLARLTRQPFVGTSLSLMRKPAKLAGLSNLQSFLERGYQAFRDMGDVDEFLQRILEREEALLAALFAGDDSLLARAELARPA